VSDGAVMLRTLPYCRNTESIFQHSKPSRGSGDTRQKGTLLRASLSDAVAAGTWSLHRSSIPSVRIESFFQAKRAGGGRQVRYLAAER